MPKKPDTIDRRRRDHPGRGVPQAESESRQAEQCSERAGNHLGDAGGAGRRSGAARARATGAGRRRSPRVHRPTPTDEEIRARAYEMYLERGGDDGLDFDDWVRAERELRQRR